MKFLRRDLTSTRSMIVKAACFVLIFLCCGALVIMPSDRDEGVAWINAAWYFLGAWSLCRAYYFVFYVITSYCDPSFRYAGVWSAVVWVLTNASAKKR